jgi:hypothetical protein
MLFPFQEMKLLLFGWDCKEFFIGSWFLVAGYWFRVSWDALCGLWIPVSRYEYDR